MLGRVQPLSTERGIAMLRRLEPILTFHWLATLGLMGLFALGAGVVSLNMFAMLRANFRLITTHGAMALMDGAFAQLLELAIYGYLAVIFYVLFKSCERVLVQRILG
jgi:hypothetical protein